MSLWDHFSKKGKQQDSATPAAAPQTSPSIAGSLFPTSPYESTSFDPASLHPLADFTKDTLDYISLDEQVLSDLPGAQSVLPSRGWSDDLCYGTGITYCSALGIGGAWGLAEGLNKLPPSAPSKLRLNAALNSITRRGPFLGNSAGVIALVYNGFNSMIGYYRGKHDIYNSMTAGFMSGALFKSMRGSRQMLISGAMVSTAAAAWTVCGNVLDPLGTDTSRSRAT